MAWDPKVYNQFKAIRYKPFFDLMELISPDGIRSGVDLGCGTGEQTAMLAAKFESASFMGIDSSTEMLAQSEKYVSDRVTFKVASIEEFAETEENWDLIFSNAALQWSDDHEKLFPKLISRLNAGGQFAVQMPVQKENLLNKILLDLVQEKPYADFLNGWKRESPVLSVDEYAGMMFDGGLQDIQIMQKVYPIIAEGPEVLFDFISGSALIPYMERLSGEEQALFVSEFRTRINKSYKRFPAMYAFKRILLYGRMEY